MEGSCPVAWLTGLGCLREVRLEFQQLLLIAAAGIPLRAAIWQDAIRILFNFPEWGPGKPLYIYIYIHSCRYSLVCPYMLLPHVGLGFIMQDAWQAAAQGAAVALA